MASCAVNVGSVLVALAAATLGALTWACGPSFQAVHEGEARFEHCYALDDSPQVPLDRKAECWNDWARHHTYGQTVDRVQYAVQRYQALSRGNAMPTDEAMMGAAPGEGVHSSSVIAPAPTNAFAPPPKVLTDQDGGAFDAGRAPPPPKEVAPAPAPAASARPPGAACVDACDGTWTACKTTCSTKPKPDKCDDCAKAYKACLKKCANEK